MRHLAHQERFRPVAVTGIERARKLAGKRGVGYQTLIKTLLHEALKKEPRIA